MKPLPPRPTPPTGGAPSVAAGPAARPPIDTRQIFRPGESAIEILHDGARYTLRLTRANKLILTK